MHLGPEGARILGALVEKQLTTPQQYPLTMNAVVAACNQTSNRDPIVDFDDATVISGLEGLKGQRLVRFVLPSHGRSVVRYRHVLDEALALDSRQCAVLAVLLLRGPQTVGELRLRTERMEKFEDLDEIEHELRYMASRSEPLVMNIGRRPGQKEERWACLLTRPSPGDDAANADEVAGRDIGPQAARRLAGSQLPRAADPLEEIRAELIALRAQIAELRGDLDSLCRRLGD